MLGGELLCVHGRGECWGVGRGEWLEVNLGGECWEVNDWGWIFVGWMMVGIWEGGGMNGEVLNSKLLGSYWWMYSTKAIIWLFIYFMAQFYWSGPLAHANSWEWLREHNKQSHFQHLLHTMSGEWSSDWVYIRQLVDVGANDDHCNFISLPTANLSYHKQNLVFQVSMLFTF